MLLVLLFETKQKKREKYFGNQVLKKMFHYKNFIAVIEKNTTDMQLVKQSYSHLQLCTQMHCAVEIDRHYE